MTEAVTSAEDTGQMPATEANLEMLQAALEALQEQIRFADTKAGFLATLNLLLFGVIAQESDKLMLVPASNRHFFYYVTLCLLVAYAVSASAAVCCVIMAVVPRIHATAAPASRFHFAHIYAAYGQDHQRFTDELLNMSHTDWAKDLAWQIMNVSHIAHTKHGLVRRGSMCTAISMGLWIISLIAIIGGRAL
jgi:Family of unknown function (DUF5706)